MYAFSTARKPLRGGCATNGLDQGYPKIDQKADKAVLAHGFQAIIQSAASAASPTVKKSSKN